MNAVAANTDQKLEIRVFGDSSLPTLVYLPGLHGDWTLAESFRAAVAGRARFIQLIYPRTLDWSMDTYTDAIEAILQAHDISNGWLLGESFGSQFVWTLLERQIEAHARGKSDVFRVDGAVLSGGFVKHPWSWGPRTLRRIGEKTSPGQYKRELGIYARYAKFRHRHAPETLASINEFVARRTELDRQAMRHRLTLLDQYDPRPIARQARIPIHYIAGLIDPLVPWPLVRRWLRRNCPGYLGGKTFWLADHNVLATAPRQSADLILKWMRGAPASSESISVRELATGVTPPPLPSNK
ncbi:MAG TPA: alpha/beta hydrolase [Terriglobales bacterium]|nr:alpha/beta hydrolase [Terriglobales bacterium]